MRNKKIETLEHLVSNQNGHIVTLLQILKHIQREMMLSLDEQTDEEERKQIIRELIFWIDKLMEYEK